MSFLPWLTPLVWLVLMGGLVILCGIIWILELFNWIWRSLK